MKTIELTRGKTAIVDDDDYDFLLQWRWIAMPSPGGMWYAARHEGRKVIFMHRVLLGLTASDETDHKNRDGLDNRRQNLRRATRTQNQQNRGHQLGGYIPIQGRPPKHGREELASANPRKQAEDYSQFS